MANKVPIKKIVTPPPPPKVSPYEEFRQRVHIDPSCEAEFKKVFGEVVGKHIGAEKQKAKIKIAQLEADLVELAKSKARPAPKKEIKPSPKSKPMPQVEITNVVLSDEKKEPKIEIEEIYRELYREANNALNDSGNRTPSGKGGLKDINHENGRMELVPFYSIYILYQLHHDYFNSKPLTEEEYKEHVYSNARNLENQEILLLFDHIQSNFALLRESSESSGESVDTIVDNILKNTIELTHKSIELLELDFHQMVLDLSKHYKEGALKYSEDNWRKGIAINFLFDSLSRHYIKLVDGWDDERHDRAYFWNLFGLIFMISKGIVEIMDAKVTKIFEIENTSFNKVL